MPKPTSWACGVEGCKAGPFTTERFAEDHEVTAHGNPKYPVGIRIQGLGRISRRHLVTDLTQGDALGDIIYGIEQGDDIMWVSEQKIDQSIEDENTVARLRRAGMI